MLKSMELKTHFREEGQVICEFMQTMSLHL